MNRAEMIEKGLKTITPAGVPAEDAAHRPTVVRILDALYPEVSTVAELEALAIGVVVRSSAGTIACRYDHSFGVVFGDERPFSWVQLALPVEVLWQP